MFTEKTDSQSNKIGAYHLAEFLTWRPEMMGPKRAVGMMVMVMKERKMLNRTVMVMG